ncbi:ribonuclease H-like domain-containing protein [Tanacetum coccineum]
MKCTSAIIQLARDIVPNFLDEYLQMSTKSSRLSLDHFCAYVMEIFRPEYLRKPMMTDVVKLYQHHEEKNGFSETRDHGPNPFILVEVVASQDLWLWHALFGISESNNDINALHQSSLFNDLKSGRAPEIQFVANGVTCPWGYYLVDGMYPELATFVKTISKPSDDDHKRIRYKQIQESERKDVERAFGVLKKKWDILANPARPMKKERMINMMYTCIVLHNNVAKKAMSIHNSVHYAPPHIHNSLRNSDDEADLNNAFIFISKLGLSHPLHLHPNDSSTLTIVSIKFKSTENYNVWSCAMLLALEEELFWGQNFSKNAYEVWDELKETFDRVDGSVTFNLHHKINSLTQNGSSVAEYFTKLTTLWKQFDAFIKLPRCTCHASDDFKRHNQLMKLMHFLMGLDDSYMQIRSNILSRDPLPDAKGAFALISSEESHRAVITGSGRSQTSGNTPRPNNNVPRPNNNGNRRTAGGSSLVCEHCGFNGHTVDRCFKLIGYPSDFGKRNNSSSTNQNFNRRFISNNNSTGSSSTFSDEQISKLLSLIKENSLNDKGKGIQANMAGANQHLTYTDKDLVIVIDISYLRIKVSHPNGTEALITKVARDSKFIVGFDELKCFLMSQDLMDVKIMGIGRQVNGLYYFDNMGGGIPLNLWAECVLTTCYLINRHVSVENSSRDLNHVNFFDEIVHESPATSNDDNDQNANGQNDGSNSPEPSSLTFDPFESDLGHSQGSNGSASSNEMTATSDHDTTSYENDGKDEKKRLDHLKQDQEMLVIKIFSERKKVFRERKKCEKIRAKRSDFQQGEEHPKCCQAKGSKDEEKLVHLKMVVRFEVLIEKKKMCSLGLMSCLGGIMVSLIFLEGLEEEALVEFTVELCEEDEDGRKNEKDGLFNLKANNQSRKA